MAPPTPQSAAARVFQITEMAEAILGSLHDMRDLFVLQRVNKSMRDTIHGSMHLRRKMYLLGNEAADEYVPFRMACNKYPRNPLLFGNLTTQSGDLALESSIFGLWRIDDQVAIRKKQRTLILRMRVEIESDKGEGMNFTARHRERVAKFMENAEQALTSSWSATRIATTDMPVNVRLEYVCSQDHRFEVRMRSMTGATTLAEFADTIKRLLAVPDRCNEKGMFNCEMRRKVDPPHGWK